MVLLHTLRSLRYVLRGRFARREPIDVFQETKGRYYAGLRMMDVFGHVNNARYLELFEFARWEQGGEMRMWEKFGKAKIIPFVAACHVHYVTAIAPCSVVEIRTRVVEATGKWWTIRQTMYNRKGDRIHAAALFRIAIIDKRKGQQPKSSSSGDNKKRTQGGHNHPVTITGAEAVARLGFDPDVVKRRLDEEWLREQGDDAATRATNILAEATDLDEEWRKVLRLQGGALRGTKPDNTAGKGVEEKE
jgi:YbgC/YbaW family acyl-CoA thioester hydrolase